MRFIEIEIFTDKKKALIKEQLYKEHGRKNVRLTEVDKMKLGDCTTTDYERIKCERVDKLNHSGSTLYILVSEAG